jgi:hypothetical protein
MRAILPEIRSDTSADPSGRKVSPQGASSPAASSTGSPRVATGSSLWPEHPASTIVIDAATATARAPGRSRTVHFVLRAFIA